MIKEQVKALWRICFDDSEEFIEMYFRLRYKTEVNVAIQSGNEVIAALQMLPYPMTFCGKTVHTSYISGACTHPDFRSKGVMRELLSQSFARMLQKGVHFSTLIPAEPWLFDYYTHMGYASVFKYSTKEIVLPEFTPSKEIVTNVVSAFQEEAYSYLNKKLSERACCIQHTPEDFRVVMSDLAVSDGKVVVARQENEVKGIAIVYKREEQIVMNELCAENKEVEQCLLHAIKQHTDCSRMIQLVPPEDKQPSHSLGMARIINVKEVLQMYAAAFPRDKMQLEVVDKQLSVNNGYYYLNNGKCMHSTERLPGAHIQMNSNELTHRIFQPLQPFMSLMLN